MHGNDIGISFYQKAAVLTDNGLLGKVDTVEFAALVVYFRFRGVYVLHLHVFGSRIEHTASESHYLARKRMYRENDASPEPVSQRAIIFAIAESGLYQIVGFISFLNGSFGQGIMAVCAVTELELLDDIIAESSSPQIGHTDTLPVNVVVKNVLKILGRILVYHEQTFAQAVCLFFFISQFAFFDFNVILSSQPFQCFIIGKLLVFHDKMNHVSSFSATETLAKTFTG